MAVWPGVIVTNNAGIPVTNNAGVVLYADDPVPGPLRDQVAFQQGGTVQARQLASGRREMRRFGKGAPDVGRIAILLDDGQVDTFEHFFQRDLNLGVNWFEADWLEGFGYTAHKARILGYPEREMTDNNVNRYSMTLLVKESGKCPDDTEWPTGPGDA